MVGEGGTPNLSTNLSVSPGAPDRKSHCRWIRVFRYICSYLQTGKYKFTTSHAADGFFSGEKKEETAATRRSTCTILSR